MNEAGDYCDGVDVPAAAGTRDRSHQPQEIDMTGSKQSDQTSKPDTLAKTSPEATVELTEAQLADASGGAIYMNPAAVADHWKINTTVDVNQGALVPAVKPVG
jgi:hypothetical protein